MKQSICSLKYSAAPIHGGYTDRILKIDLSNNRIEVITLDPEFKEKYIGGRGYALKLLWDGTDKNTKYNSPDNILVMAGGPLCNESRFPGAGKFIVGTISPLTDTFMDSNVGGYFSPVLKACGFDALAVTGIGNEKVLIIIDDDKGEICISKAPVVNDQIEKGGISYGEMLISKYTDNNLHKNVAAVTTGIGASTTNFGLINSHFYDSQRKRIRIKQAGRGGTGTVMRYKNLMGVIVNSSKARLKNNNPIDKQGVKQAGGALAKVIKNEDPKQLQLARWGTPVLTEYMNNFHLLPINNYQLGQHEKATEVFSDVFFNKYLKVKRADGCYFGCNLACAKGAEEVTLQSGFMAGQTVGIDGPEYETVGAATALGVFNPQFVMDYNWYCDEYGVDTISMGVTMAFIMECYQRGFLSEEDIGYKLEWGDLKAVERLFHETASAIGIGKVCGMGISKSKIWVAERHSSKTGQNIEKVLEEINKFAMEVKGLEFSMYISRESLAQQGGYGFALKGPQHDEAWLIFLDQVHKELGTFDMKTKALKWFPLIRTWFNAVGLCKLPWIDVRNPEAENTDNPAQNLPSFNLYVQFLNATTGSNKSIEDILQDSERLHLIQKMINLRQGKGTREYDQIPLRAMGPAFPEEYEARSNYYDQWLETKIPPDETIPESTIEKHALLVQMRQKEYQTLCDTVYKAKGYNRNAVPLTETLEKFDILDEKAIAILAEYKTTAGMKN